MSRHWRRIGILVALLVVLGFAVARPVRAESRAECRSVPSKILASDVAYCVFLPPSYDADKTRQYPILYFLHGLGENAQILLNSGGWNLIQDLRQQKDIGDFVIVTPSADRSFYIDSSNGRVRYQDFFIKEFIPYIEKHYRIEANRRERGIMGISMGGYGALRMAFLFPDLFGSVSAHSAALIEKLPATQGQSPQAENLARLVGTAFGVPFDREFWDRNNPFTLVRTGPPTSNLKIYFDCGTEDQFGFDIGAQAFDKLLTAKGIAHEFHLYPGGHDWNYFGEHFPASLEFESRAFGVLAAGKGN
jgi:S-formylglutathione hydrolase FrmB